MYDFMADEQNFNFLFLIITFPLLYSPEDFFARRVFLFDKWKTFGKFHEPETTTFLPTKVKKGTLCLWHCSELIINYIPVLHYLN